MTEIQTTADAIPLPLPLFWPVAMVAGMEKAKADLALRNLEFVQEDLKIHGDLKPKLATPNVVRLDLRTMALRDYGRPGGIPTLVNAPFAGHRAMIADYHKGQSLVETLLANGVGHVALTDWKSATDDMKDFDIDNYLEELIVAIDDLGGRVNLVGLCQGGWSSAMVAARFPDKVNALVLAGSPIDTDAGDGPIKRMAHDTPMSAYEDLVKLGGGLMRGQIMLAGWKNMHPEKHYVAEALDLYQHMDDPAYKERVEVFDSLVRRSARPARALVSARDPRALQGEPPRQGRVRGARPPPEPEVNRVPRFISSPARATTSRPRSRFSRRRTSSEPRKAGSRRSWSPADTSVSSWARAR